MKKLLIYFIILALAMPSFSQKVVSAVSDSYYINITKDPPKPPYLEINSSSLQFIDHNGNNKIDAGETAGIRFEVSNTGVGSGLNMIAKMRQVAYVKGINFSESTGIGKLEPNQQKWVELSISGTMDIPDGETEFEIYIDEANGFDSDPVSIVIPTASFRSPLLKLADYKISSQSGTTLEKRRPFELQVLLQNVGQGVADNVSLSVLVPSNMYCLSANESISLIDLKPGETQLVDYSFVATADYDSPTISFVFTPSEKYGKYAESRTISLSMNQQVSSERMIVQGEQEAEVPISLGSLSSMVDRNIPHTDRKVDDRLALVIGNEYYDRGGLLNTQINVDYARNDATVFREYALKTLGVKEENMFFLTDASAGAMKREIDRVAELLKRLGPDAELIFYYAGHGLPDEATRVPYLIPVDVDATNLAYAIRLSDVYRKFSETGAGRITVFLDACFSGGARNQPLLAARSVRIKPQTEVIGGNMLIFAASSGDQSSLPYHKEKHGLFTYLLLNKLQESGGDVVYGELADYLKREVGIISLRENGKLQDPEVLVGPEVDKNWREWKLK